MSVRPRRYRKRPVEVEALRFTGEPSSAATIVRWILDGGGKASYETVDMDTVTGMIGIETPVGRMHATPGDFIICGVYGDFYPCKPEIFAGTHESTDVINVSDANRDLIYRAYDDGDDNTVTLFPGEVDGYFEGHYDDGYVMEGTEINGTLYCICPQSYGGMVAVLVGEELVDNAVGVAFQTVVEARAYIQGLTAK